MGRTVMEVNDTNLDSPDTTKLTRITQVHFFMQLTKHFHLFTASQKP